MVDRARAVLWLAGYALAAGALAQNAERELPPAYYYPRARTAWEAVAAREASLPPSFKEAYPDQAAAFDALLGWASSLPAAYTADGIIYNDALAAQLVSELYRDFGHPLLNIRAQDQVLDVIRHVAHWPDQRLGLGAREVLTAGLVEYVDAGGGQYSPSTEADLATTLGALGAEGTAVNEVVEALLLDALRWAENVQSDVERKRVHRWCEKRWGDTFWLRLHEMQPDGTLLPLVRRGRYDRAVAALAALLSDRSVEPDRLARRVREATQAALGEFREEVLSNDLTCRLLIAYRCLLARRPMVSERISDYIDDRLLWLAARSDRLKTERHWDLWTQAVSELRPARISERFKSYLQAMLKTKDLPEPRRSAIESLHFLTPDQDEIGKAAKPEP